MVDYDAPPVLQALLYWQYYCCACIGGTALSVQAESCQCLRGVGTLVAYARPTITPHNGTK